MPDEVVQTPFGAFLVTRGEIIGETTRAGTLWDGPGFLQVIAKGYGELGTPGVTILDVGANQGAFSIWLARQGAWRVLALEPQPIVMQRLKANLDLNRDWTAPTVIPLELAAYDKPGGARQIGELDPGNWGGTAFSPLSTEYVLDEGAIPALPLDHLQWLCGARVSLVKIDAQGADGRILLGMTQLLKRDRPVVVFEWEPALVDRHFLSWDAIWRFLIMDVGYSVHEWPSQPGNYLALPRKDWVR
jgi:FkbM family methyltransferase